MAREVTFVVFWILTPYGLVERYRWFRGGLANMRNLRKVSAALKHLNNFVDVVRGIERTWGKYEYGTVLQVIIQLIYFTVCSCIYRICSNRIWGKYEYEPILQLIIQLIYFTDRSCIYRICSDRTWGKYEYGTIFHMIKLTYIQKVKYTIMCNQNIIFL